MGREEHLLTLTRKAGEFVTIVDESTGRAVVVVVQQFKNGGVRLSFAGSAGLTIQRSRGGDFMEHRANILAAVNNPTPGPTWEPVVELDPVKGTWNGGGANRITGERRNGRISFNKQQARKEAAVVCQNLNRVRR